MKLAKLLEKLEILEANASLDMEVSGVAYDSRQVETGFAFVAIAGFATDGNKYIPMAAQKGAAVVITEKKPDTAIPYVLVASAREALAIMGCNWYDYPATKMKMVGVTGTNGKTSVTMLLKSVLERVTGEKVGLIGTIQNMIGDEIIPTERTTPESFALQGLFAQMVEAGCAYCVMEVSSHALALDRVGGVHFDAAVFTNLTEDHLDFHKTMEDYCAAKAMLFSRCETGVYNLDDPYCEKMLQNASGKRLTTSLKDEKADIFGKNVVFGSDSVSFTAVCGEKMLPMQIGIPGGFTAYNALSVLSAAAALGLPLEEAAAALALAHGVKGRVEVIPTPGLDFTVLTDYAHTPDALENVLQTVQGFCKGRVVALFGCGGDRDPIKRPMMGKIAAEQADFVIVTSDNPRSEEPMAIIRDILPGLAGIETPYTVICDRREAIFWGLAHCKKDDVLVLAGKGHETYQEISGEKRHFDEREEVAFWLRKHGKGADVE